MIIRLYRVSAFCVRLVSVVPIIFRKCRINLSTKVLVNRGLFLKSFIRIFHAQISAYACLVNETQCLLQTSTLCPLGTPVKNTEYVRVGPLNICHTK